MVAFGAMSEAKFQVAYDGPGVVNGSMDVRVLAPALLALGDLISASNEALNGDTATASLRVESDFKDGSFEVSLLLSHTLIETVKNLFSENPAAGALGLFTAIFGTTKAATGAIEGLFKLYKALHGEKPKTAIIDQSTHTTIFVIGDGNEVRADETTARLYADDRILQRLDQVVRPVSERQIDYLEVRKEEEVVDRVERTDLPQRLIEPQGPGLIEAPETSPDPAREILLQVTKPNFDGGRWSFFDGANKFGADIEDEAFNEKVKRREEGFFEGDTLRVMLRTAQRVSKDGKLEATHTIERVIEHRHAPREQNLLSFISEDSESDTDK
ncbi:MAG: hypothetical protein WBM14_17845 [Terracidiphilus sp.]|jgi:hypothetical protein